MGIKLHCKYVLMILMYNKIMFYLQIFVIYFAENIWNIIKEERER